MQLDSRKQKRPETSWA